MERSVGTDPVRSAAAVAPRPEGSDDLAPRLAPAERRMLAFLFLVVGAVAAVVAGGHSYAIDNEVQLQTTRSLVQLESGLESVDAYWVTVDPGPYRVRDDGSVVSVVGIGHSLVSAPFYAVSRVLAQPLPEDDRDSFVRIGTSFTNSVVLALTAVALALLVRELRAPLGVGVAVAATYALCTYALPHSKTYFTELSSALVLTAGVVAAVRLGRRGDPRLAVACGALAGAGVLIRASGVLFIPVFAMWMIAVRWRRAGPRAAATATAWFALGGVGPAVAFLGFNQWRFGSPFDAGYRQVPQSFPIVEGLLNHFFTPGKSLFLFAPVIVLGMIGLAVGLRRQNATVLLCGALVAVNLGFFSRVPFWSGDAAWGPRYQQIVLPLMCAPAAVLFARRWFRPALATSAVIGALLPSLLGSLIYFNVLFIEAADEQVPSSALTHELAWQPFLGHAELVPIGIRDVIDANRADERERGPYSSDPSTHYGYFGWEPRIDVWWLWIGPMGATPATYVFVIPIAAALFLAVAIARGGGRAATIGIRAVDRLTSVGSRRRGDADPGIEPDRDGPAGDGSISEP